MNEWDREEQWLWSLEDELGINIHSPPSSWWERVQRRSSEKALETGGQAEYFDYINSELWEERKALWERESGKCARVCFVCGMLEAELHHVTYERLGHERFEDLLPLCDIHHREVHRYLRRRGWGVRQTLSALASLHRWAPEELRARIESLGAYQESLSRRSCEPTHVGCLIAKWLKALSTGEKGATAS